MEPWEIASQGYYFYPGVSNCDDVLSLYPAWLANFLHLHFPMFLRCERCLILLTLRFQCEMLILLNLRCQNEMPYFIDCKMTVRDALIY